MSSSNLCLKPITSYCTKPFGHLGQCVPDEVRRLQHDVDRLQDALTAEVNAHATTELARAKELLCRNGFGRRLIQGHSRLLECMRKQARE